MRHESDTAPAPVRRVPEPIPYPSQGEVIGVLETSEGQWRVEVILREGDQHLRIIHVTTCSRRVPTKPRSSGYSVRLASTWLIYST